MRNGVTERDKGWNRIKAETNALGGKSVKVGLQNDGTMGEDGETLVAQYAYYNEFGTSRIPARPFMRTAYDKNRPDLLRTTRKLWDGVMDGKLSAAQAAGVLGERHAEQVDQTIVSLDSPANAESTIERKGSSNPLIDSGQMRQSVRYVVEDK
jgi:hypothetical protein